MSDAWCLLSISDIHFASDSKLDDARQLEWPALREDVFPNFYNLLDGFPQRPLDLIAVVGDITTRGNKEGFDVFAAETLPRLRALVNSEAAICIVPGNHDVKWGLDPEISNFFNQMFTAFKEVADTDYTCCLFPDGKLTKNANYRLKAA